MKSDIKVQMTKILLLRKSTLQDKQDLLANGWSECIVFSFLGEIPNCEMSGNNQQVGLSVTLESCPVGNYSLSNRNSYTDCGPDY